MVYAMLIGVVLFLIVIMVAVTFFSSFFENLYIAFAEQLETSKNRSTNPTGSTSCDLRFEIYPSFDEPPFAGILDLEVKQRLWLGIASPNSGGQVYHPEVATALFRECHTQQSGIGGFFQNIAPTFSIEKIRNVQASLLALTNLFSTQSFQVDMEVFKVRDGTAIGTKVVRVTEPQHAKLPFNVPNQVFVFDNVELTDYNVHITCSGDCFRVNNLPTGEPYIYRIRP